MQWHFFKNYTSSNFISFGSHKGTIPLVEENYYFPLSSVPNYTRNILQEVELEVRCTLIYFVISFSETLAIFWKVHTVLMRKKGFWWLIPLFSCLMVLVFQMIDFVITGFYFIIKNFCKQCPLCNKMCCANYIE